MSNGGKLIQLVNSVNFELYIETKRTQNLLFGPCNWAIQLKIVSILLRLTAKKRGQLTKSQETRAIRFSRKQQDGNV